MTRFLIAAVAAALCGNVADAQIIARRYAVPVYPGYVAPVAPAYPAYSYAAPVVPAYSTYSYPAYSTVVPAYSYAPAAPVVTASYVTPGVYVAPTYGIVRARRVWGW